MKIPTLIELWKRMSNLTAPKCTTCRVPHSCCAPEYCEMAKDYAKDHYKIDISDKITDHKTLPFMGKNGCVIEPHFRPLCTLHVCSISSLGFDKDSKFTEKYFKLRDTIEDRLNRGE